MTEESDPLNLAAEMYRAIVSGQWWMAASVAVVFLVWILRKFGARIFPKLQPALANPVVSFALPTLAAMAGAVTTSLASGMPIKPALLAGLKVALGAVFAYVGMKKVDEARTAGKEAAAEIKTDSDASNILRIGPKP